MNNWHYRNAWVQLGIRQNLIGLEVGTDKGTNARYMLQNLNIQKLYLIDPYFDQSDEFDDDGERSYVKDTKPREAYKIAHNVLKPFADKIEWFIGTTEQMIHKIPDNHLDFCYIDGCHKYESVKSDIELCLPKVRNGGVLGGHDFVQEHQGVLRAVLEKFDRNDLFCANRDWWIIKK